MRRGLVAGAVVATLVGGPATAAFAETGQDFVTTCPGGVCVEVGTPGRPGGSSGGGSSGSGSGGPGNCSYRPADPSSQTIAALGGQPAGGGGWYWSSCTGGIAVGTGTLGVLVWLSTPPVVSWLSTPPVVSPEQLAQQARSRLELPAVTLAVNPAGTALVNLPVWLALSGGWLPQSASASVPGMSVVATARPEKVTFDLGNGSTVVCQGPGTVYRPGVHDPAAASPDCGTVYRLPSIGLPNESYRITATVTWGVSWAGGGQSGTIAGLTSSGSTTLRVAESQSVITR